MRGAGRCKGVVSVHGNAAWEKKTGARVWCLDGHACVHARGHAEKNSRAVACVEAGLSAGIVARGRRHLGSWVSHA